MSIQINSAEGLILVITVHTQYKHWLSQINLSWGRYIYTVQNILRVKYKHHTHFILLCLPVLQGSLANVLFLPHWHSSQVRESQNSLGWKQPVRVMNPAFKWMTHTGIKPTALVLTSNWTLSTKTICRRKPTKPNPHGVSVGAVSKSVVNIKFS